MSFAGFSRKFFFELRFAKLVKLAPARAELRIANCELRIANFAARGLICQALLRKFAVFFALPQNAYRDNYNMALYNLQGKN